ncbi:type-4 ice-structuring protein LS-12-like [Girardinichthys multiradiatus]|uniref:type-4 ice-structuring protein LS-12-like n=1 Tax=Girardinichthys multiradiatus TaxID=208333 RepID=UPI001FABC257|nr:type-4 ice-structuring protein LS-12-like [Girardinichthys multiradiatus]
MKLFLIAALLVLALTHGSFAQDGAEQMNQYLQNIKAKINQDFQEFVGHQELKDQAESFLEDRQMDLEPLAAKFQDQLQDLKAVAANMEDQIKPLTAKVREQVNPLIYSLQEKMEAMLQTLAKHTKTDRK